MMATGDAMVWGCQHCVMLAGASEHLQPESGAEQVTILRCASQWAHKGQQCHKTVNMQGINCYWLIS